jgi:peptidoglycan-associated lipoprotein
MGCRTRAHSMFVVALLIGVLAVWSCAKKPEVFQTGPAITGPGAGAGSSSVAPGTGSPSGGGDVPVTRPTAPTEIPIAGGAPKVGSSALPGSGAAGASASPLKDVFFEYDQAIISAEQKAALDDNARWLKTNANARIAIEGHCDERGPVEYNLGLGDRRAKAVRDYLISSGIAGGRISTISYGKERPFVPGHDEKAWRQNRRAHLALQPK